MISRRMMMNDKIVTQSGKQLVLEKCKGSYFNEFSMYGKSTQVKTTGVNLANGMDNVYKKEQSGQQKQSYCWGYSLGGGPLILDKPLKAGTYTFSFYSDATASIYLAKAPYVTGQFVQYFVNQKVTGDIKNGLQRYFCLFQLTDERDLIGIYSDGYTTCFGGMINFGDKPLPYEPYTGGKPSPSPEYPQKIVSAGDNGKIEVEVFGTNICPVSSETTNFMTFTKVYPGVPYSICAKQSIPTMLNIMIVEENDTSAKNPIEVFNNLQFVKGVITFEPTKTGYVYVNSHKGTEYSGVCIYAGTLLEYQYEPYKPAQTLTLKTPNGLPGIPVKSGGNYTDSAGQQWVCDEIDLSRGEKVQRVGNIIFDGSDDEKWSFIQDGLKSRAVIAIQNIDSGARCNSFRYCESLESKSEPSGMFDLGSGRYFRFGIYGLCNSVEEWRTLLQTEPVEVLYILPDPIFTPLSPEEIAAYRALHTYEPTTTITNDAGAGMAVSYRKVRG